MTKRSKESEETFKTIAPGSLWQGVNSWGDRVVGYRLPSGNGVWLKGGDGWRWRDRPWRYGWPWGAGDMPGGERDFVVIGVYPSLEALSNDQIKALCECVSDVAAVKVGDSVTWDQVPMYALVHAEGDRYAVRIAETLGSDGWSCVVNEGYTGSATWKYFTGAREITTPVTVVSLDLKRGFNANQVPPLVAAYKALPLQVIVYTKPTQVVKVGDTIDWYTTPDNAMVRDSDGGIALRRGSCGQWRSVKRNDLDTWGEYISFAWDASRGEVCRRTDDVVVVALDVPLDCTSNKQLETCALNAATLREPAPVAKKDIVVGDRIAWDDAPHWALVHIEDDQYAIRFDDRGRSAHADGTYWRPKHKDIQKWQGLHTTCTVVALTEYGTTSGEADRLVAAHEAQRAAPKVGDKVAWDKVPDNAMVKADGGCIALRRGARGQWYKNKYPTGWSTSSYIAFDWTDKGGARRDDNDAEIVALDVPPDAEASVATLKLVAGVA